ncbi:MAG TPA: right-handed parallel beta-helix repeat-containing protein [Aquabacterium sp.]|uniref:right-handed parallel beta-helix repeat-containing protein n=1 Tax=Aquabacterium sp. TaxID=1872578 RepID=UPI002E3730B3|nr:right-handed parallel beta-helix repeat-containing protein [Aquabacterium sp.]HEX5355597.1 right-handed parallel beta-helix repeat-containing protein [Aquabacterium sp.]
MFRYPMPVAAASLAALVMFGSNALAADCPAYVSKTLDAGTLTAPDQQAIINKLAEIPLGNGAEIRLIGQFSIKQSIPIVRDCVRFISDVSTAPATLTWTAPLPAPDQPARIFLQHGDTGSKHHLEIKDLVLVNAGVHVNGSEHTISGNRFSQGQASLSVYQGDHLTIQGNTFTDVGGVGAWVMHNSLVDRNTFIRAVQPVSITSEGNGNTISNNVGTGTYYFGIEFLGKSSLPGIERFVNNTITNNSFTAPSQPTPGNHGAYGGISIVAGANNLISGNVVDCGLVCRAPDTVENVRKKISYSQKGDLIGIGIEVADAGSRVINNTVRGFNSGIFISDPQSDISAMNDVATLDGNKIYTTNQGIAINCYQGPANGVEPNRANIGRCRRAYVIQNNLVQEARDIGIGGNQNFYYPTGTKDLRYVMSMASESTAMTIYNNKVTRSYGSFPGDASVKRPYKRFVGISVGPIINPDQQRVTYNRIEMKGAPPLGSEFGFTGIELTPYTQYDAAPPCTVLPNGKTLTGMLVANNTITHMTSPFGKGIAGTCHIDSGVLFQSNTYSGLSLPLDLQ